MVAHLRLRVARYRIHTWHSGYPGDYHLLVPGNIDYHIQYVTITSSPRAQELIKQKN